MKALRLGRIPDVQIEVAPSAIGLPVVGGLIAGWQLRVNYPLWTINQICLATALWANG
jgi:hypothetical protein